MILPRLSMPPFTPSTLVAGARIGELPPEEPQLPPIGMNARAETPTIAPLPAQPPGAGGDTVELPSSPCCSSTMALVGGAVGQVPHTGLSSPPGLQTDRVGYG